MEPEPISSLSEENFRQIVARFCQRPIAFNPSFIRLPKGSVSSALFLSQALYWMDRIDRDGWFYKTRDEWTAETGLTRWEQERARKILRECGILEERLSGTPAKLHYRVNCATLCTLLSQLDGGKTSNQLVEKPPTSWAETNQPYKEAEITTEITTEIKPLPASRVGDLPKKEKQEADPRYKAFVEILHNGFKKRGWDFGWDQVDGKKLKDLLKLRPNWTGTVFAQAVANYFSSEGVQPGGLARKFLTKLPDFAAGPLDRYGKPLKQQARSPDPDISPGEVLKRQLAEGNRKAAT